MQVGDHEQALLGPIKHAVGIGDQENAGNGDAFVPDWRRAACCQNHCIASFTNSSAASANSESDASP